MVLSTGEPVDEKIFAFPTFSPSPGPTKKRQRQRPRYWQKLSNILKYIFSVVSVSGGNLRGTTVRKTGDMSPSEEAGAEEKPALLDNAEPQSINVFIGRR